MTFISRLRNSLTLSVSSNETLERFGAGVSGPTESCGSVMVFLPAERLGGPPAPTAQR